MGTRGNGRASFVRGLVGDVIKVNELNKMKR